MKYATDLKELFVNKLNNEDFVIDKNGGKVIELIGESFIVNTFAVFGTINEEYVAREIDWYASESLNVYDMPKTPLIWKQISDKDGYINSNYGWCIFSKENGEQFKNVIRTLRKDKDSRRATMIYNRPAMHTDYNKNGMSDFMCTNAVNYYIRDNKLNAVVQMRSNDLLFGYKNDSKWADYVLDKMISELLLDYPELQKGNIIWNAGSLHVYERHFNLIKL